MMIHGSERQDKEEENKKAGSFKTEVDKFFQENIDQIADRFFLNYKAEWMEASALRAELRVILRKYLKMLSNTHNTEPTMNVDQAIEALDKQKQYRIRNARVLKEIKNILVGKGYDVEYMDIEKLPDIIANGMVGAKSYLKPKPCQVNHEAHSDKDLPCYVCGELLNPDF